VLFLFFLSLLVHDGEGKVFGIILAEGGNGTQTLLEVVQIDTSTGKTTIVAQTIIYVGMSIVYNGISGYDQNHQRLFFSTNFLGDYVYVVDTSKGASLPTISVGGSFINSIVYNNAGDQVLIDTLYADKSEAIVAIPYDPNSSTKLLVNLTTLGIGSVYDTTLDSKTGTYYAIYDKASQFYLASFSLLTPTKVTTVAITCGTTPFAPNHVFYDSVGGRLLGIGFNSGTKVYDYFEIVSSKCSTRPTGLPGTVSCAGYDPTSSILYFGYLGQSAALVLYDTHKYTLTQVSLTVTLSDIQISYT